MLSEETVPTVELCLDPAREEPRDENTLQSLQRDNEKYRDLADAFQSFSQVSNQLTESYYQLQNHVVSLQQELEHESRQRIKECEDKQKIENRLDSLLDLLPGGVVVLDRSGKVEQCNPAALELLGAPLIERNWSEIIDHCFAPKADDGHEISMVDGRRLSISTRSLESGKGQIILLTDQTETRQLQGRLARHERLSTMGKMVAYLAHQIRTPLSAAMLYGGHLCAGTLGTEKQQEFAAKLVKQLKHVEQQIKDLLIFARGEILLKQKTSVEEILHDIESSTEALICQTASSCEISSELKDVTIHCNRESVVGAVVNLVNNAIEACVGSVQIQISAVVEESEGIPCLILSVKDDGPGICQENISRILEPFFTTKAQGTGLGLAIVQAVAGSHQGTLLLDSKPGEGTLASLVLPVIRPLTSTADPA